MKTWHVVGTALLVAAAGVAAQDPPPERKALKVCQDPNNLPFSNTRGEGIENKIAEVFGKALGLPVTYYSFPNRLAFIRMAGNIMDNAMRFTQAGGRITLAGFAADDGVVIEISDTGIGMSEERLASLSQPFALGDATFTRDGVGPGLGISIARAIAELSGGRMAIDSSPALGTTVAITLPLDPAATDLLAA